MEDEMHPRSDDPFGKPIAILGAGSIGVGFALVFGKAGFNVRVFDPDPDRIALMHDELRVRLEALMRNGLLDDRIDAVLARIAAVDSLAAAVEGAALVQECAPEVLSIKQSLFFEADRFASPDAILASSSSFLQISLIATGLPGDGRCIVGHPGNPPYLLPIIEIVPAPFTTGFAVARAAHIYESAGLSPVHVRREIEGFVFNRLQGALLREAYCLVRDGVASVEDIDRTVRDGLGMRWSVVGPFETADLNTRGGIAAHAERMGPFYARMGAERGQDDPWTRDLVVSVASARRSELPLNGWQERVLWRDERLMELFRLRQAWRSS